MTHIANIIYKTFVCIRIAALFVKPPHVLIRVHNLFLKHHEFHIWITFDSEQFNIVLFKPATHRRSDHNIFKCYNV